MTGPTSRGGGGAGRGEGKAGPLWEKEVQKAPWENDVYMYFDHTPNEGVRGSFDSTKPLEYENAALDAIRKRHDSENGGILMGIYTRVA